MPKVLLPKFSWLVLRFMLQYLDFANPVLLIVELSQFQGIKILEITFFRFGIQDGYAHWNDEVQEILTWKYLSCTVLRADTP